MDVILGAAGTVGSATTGLEAADGGPKPTRFSAATVHR
jgi:hypothetical protein